MSRRWSCPAGSLSPTMSTPQQRKIDWKTDVIPQFVRTKEGQVGEVTGVSIVVRIPGVDANYHMNTDNCEHATKDDKKLFHQSKIEAAKKRMEEARKRWSNGYTDFEKAAAEYAKLVETPNAK